ncbi:MAG: type II secretion system F family protein [Planctomycetota bacterium]|nr:type II secretion system F family protein [Planctomycetota bacterium]
MLFAKNLISFETLIPFAVFAGIAAVAWWVMDMMATGKPRAMERLDEFKNPPSRRKLGVPARGAKKSDRMSKVFENAAPKLAKPLVPKSELEMSNLKVKLANAGFRGEAASTTYLGLKFIGLMAGLFFGGGGILGLYGANIKTIFAAVMTAIVLFYLPTIIVAMIGHKRKQAVFLGLPDALDLMVVCVEAGLGLDQAMKKVSEELNKTHPIIADEFSLSNLQLQMGSPRDEVLHDLGVRTGVSDVRALVGVLIQAGKFGSSIAQALRVQSDAMRVRRRQLAEEKAAKTAVKLIFPLVLFIFPGIFVILVGPAGITIMREMNGKM